MVHKNDGVLSQIAGGIVLSDSKNWYFSNNVTNELYTFFDLIHNCSNPSLMLNN